jgi:membrane protein DedA with SNARE-associated domain
VDSLQTALDFLGRHGYAVALVAVAIDATALPFPGRLALVAAGARSARAELNLHVVVLLGALGALATDHLWYFAGRLGTTRAIVDRYCRFMRGQGCLERARAHLGRYGPLVSVVGRFFAGVRVVAVPLAASSGIPYGQFLLYDFAGALLWAGTFVVAGRVLGDQAPIFVERFGTAGGIAAAALATLVLAYVLARRWRAA